MTDNRQKGTDEMRRKIVEESRTLSSLSLEMDASGRLKPMVKLYFQSPQEIRIIWDIILNNLDGKQDNLGHKAIRIIWDIKQFCTKIASCPDYSEKQEILVLERDAWGRFVSPGKSKAKGGCKFHESAQPETRFLQE